MPEDVAEEVKDDKAQAREERAEARKEEKLLERQREASLADAQHAVDVYRSGPHGDVASDAPTDEKKDS